MRRIIIILTALLFTTILLIACSKSVETMSATEMLDLGEKYLLELNYEEAVVQFTKLIEVEPQNPRGYLGAAEAYIALGESDKAVAVLEKGQEQLPDNTDIAKMLAELMKLGSAPPSTPNPTLEPTPSLSSEPTSDPKSDDEINTFTYSNLSYTFEWEIGWGSNENALGCCQLTFDLVGDYSDAVAVLIAAGTNTISWTPENIQEQIGLIIPKWKNANVVSGRSQAQFNGKMSGSSFPIDEAELGITGDVLCLVVNSDCEPIGYVLVPVTIPATAG